ncbi:hypothetical protein [Methylocystis parvus]|uniref:Uncharacterized protein n=1 Tax=Methylocystis parvus TaxID=134 RepID=A0A6B8M625_9HYPH|nr:hypothetical protein [Methylocystis parvus]QGM96783.1 hypothetical protein F7D14_04375 [Methylocystis parvus]WBJ99341.1 hypothetical protein MMG94_15250 [Methylocystis parvus OBBP]
MSFGGLLTGYFVLLALLGLELGVSFLRLDPSLRLLILLPALAMVWIVATRFMGLRREGPATLLFATSGVVWLVILLGLGLADPLTRAIYPAPESGRSSAMKAAPFP